MADCVRRRVRVYGMVQGVMFRAACRHQASKLDVAGWVRNLGDGSVEAVFEGEPEAVEAMLRWCGRGPSAARVDRVDVDHREPPSGESGFEVKV